jgi:hypothetical protein
MLSKGIWGKMEKKEENFNFVGARFIVATSPMMYRFD